MCCVDRQNETVLYRYNNNNDDDDDHDDDDGNSNKNQPPIVGTQLCNSRISRH